MNVKRIDEKLRKAIMMAYQYQINCELTPSQCKELIDYIDNPLELEEVCEWKVVSEYIGDGERSEYLVTTCNFDEHKSILSVGYQCCPVCGRRIVYKESE